MNGFTRTDFLDTCAKKISMIIDLNYQSSFIFNIAESNDIEENKQIVKNLSIYLKKELIGIKEEDISIVDILKVDWKNLSLLPSVCIFDCSNMSNSNISILSSKSRDLKNGSKKLYLFHFKKSQHQDVAVGFEPFQLREKTMFELDNDLLKYANCELLSYNMSNENKDQKKKIKI